MHNARTQKLTVDESRYELQLLAEQIKYHEKVYRSGLSEIPDSAFDTLVERYTELADQLAVEPAQRLDVQIASEHTDGFATVKHCVPMLSLEKLTYGRQRNPTSLLSALTAWYAKRRDELELHKQKPLPLLVEPKIDGISISLRYEAGHLVRAVTRGDGKHGDDITSQVRRTGAVPERLANVATGTLEIRGELYWPRRAFVQYNNTLASKGQRQLINPRNGCAGIMKRKDPKGLEHCGIRSFLYQIAWHDNVSIPSTQLEILHWLREQGADVYLDEVQRTDNPHEALAYCEAYDSRRATLDYDIDGMVIKIDTLKHYEMLGATGHHPHWGIAYKFAPERKLTKLREIRVQVGKSGKLTPVAELEPIEVSQTTVSRASLHNFAEIERKDIREGDYVWIEKAGEIIPYVVDVDKTQRPANTAPCARPNVCPSCSSTVIRDEPFLYCPNPACPDQLIERIKHFASRAAMDIEGLGTALIEQLVNQLGITTPDALFSIKADQLSGLERMGKKSAQNVITSITAARDRGLSRVLVGLAIRHVGETMAEELARHFKDIESLLAFSARYVAGDIQAIADVAPGKGCGAIVGLARKSADSIFTELNSPAVRATLQGLAAAGVSLKASTDAKYSSQLTGQTFVLTGTLSSLKRADAIARIKAAGGKIGSTVSKNTDYVVAGADAGGKLQRAEQLGIDVIDEPGLLRLLAETANAGNGTHTPKTLSSDGSPC